MKLYLVQHAEAKKEEEDPQRPITEKGIIETKKIAEYLKKIKGIEVDTILHSGKLRSQQTAEIFAEILKPNDGCWSTDGLTPDADPQIWLNNIHDTQDNIMLVGHLPHLQKLVSTLILHDTEKKIINLKNAGIICLEKGSEGNWAIEFIITPEII